MQQALLIIALLASNFASVSGKLPLVQTTSGSIIGHAAPNSSDVTEFLGIRYAEAPVGDLRFAAPKKHVASTGTVFEAAEWVDNCRNRSHQYMLMNIVRRLPVQQAAREQFPEFHSAIRPASVEELCSTKQQLGIGRLPQAQHLDEESGCHKGEEGGPSLSTRRPYDNSFNPALVIIDASIGFQIPGSHSQFYNGQYLSGAEDVVVVTSK
jgi:hypothetical protein